MFEISTGDRIVIQSLAELKNLGYEKDDPSMFEHADKSYEVSGIVRLDRDLCYYIVKGTNQMFIDADIKDVVKKVTVY